MNIAINRNNYENPVVYQLAAFIIYFFFSDSFHFEKTNHNNSNNNVCMYILL